MAYVQPKVDWSGVSVPKAGDFNRIEGNIAALKTGVDNNSAGITDAINECKLYTNTKIAGLTIPSVGSIGSMIDAAIVGLATEGFVEGVITDAFLEFVNSVLSSYATEEYVDTEIDNAVDDLATKEYVDTAVNGLATEGYVDSAITDALSGFDPGDLEGMATEGYVNSAINDAINELTIPTEADIRLATSAFTPELRTSDRTGEGDDYKIWFRTDLSL